ncbi:MAG: EAL domain-containing protein [Saccharofermentans sp.]|nr:EAL domain-containing protein [Saccharofermentans sp.]
MAKRDQRYKIPRNWIVIPLIVYTLLFLVIYVAISFTIAFVSVYAAKIKADAEIDKTADLAALYEQVYSEESEEDPEELEKKLDEVFKVYKELGHDVVVADNDANVIYSVGKPTVLLEKVEEIDEATRTELEIGISKITDEEDHISISEKIFSDLVGNFIFFPDKETQYAEVQQNIITPDIFEMMEKIFKDNFNVELTDDSSDDDMIIHYWTAFRVRDNSELIAFKTSINFKTSDTIYLLIISIAAYLIVAVIFIILVVNIIRAHLNNKKMRRIVFRDDITGNRNWFWFAVKSRQLIRKRRSDTQYALVSLTFVRYRNFVLCHSIDVGEHTLKMIWNIIDGSLDKKEICAHTSPAGFPMLIKVRDEDHAREKIMSIIKRLELIGGDHDFKFQAGVYMVDPKIRKNADIDLLYNNASSARATLESSDDTGIAFFGEKLVEDEKWIDTVTERQREAVLKEEFKVYYQPKYDPRTNELMGAEALIRWVSSDLGFVSPGRFIPIFEKSGFITEIDHYMVSHVARDQKKWLDEGRKCVPVSVNISRAHFAEVNLADQIRDMVDKVGTPHDLIEIELTESAFFDDKKQMLTTIKKLKEYGFLVSMDDFGSGYSSLNSLKDMPLDILKLDAGFFKGEADNSRAEIVVSEAIRLAKKLNMQTVAEGVEDQAQVDFLASEGCNMIQGYYYAKPMPRDEYESRINPNVQQAAPGVAAEAPETVEDTQTEVREEVQVAEDTREVVQTLTEDVQATETAAQNNPDVEAATDSDKAESSDPKE